MYGRVPHVAPQAWLHIIYPGLGRDAIAEIERGLGRKVPKYYAAFLGRANGLTIYSGTLNLYGRRTDYSRDPEIRQPFDLSVPNVKERPRAAQDSWFIIGAYKADGSCVYLDDDDPRVYRANRDMSRPSLNVWSTLGEFLDFEIHRLAGHFDDLGRRLDDTRPTTPD